MRAATPALRSASLGVVLARLAVVTVLLWAVGAVVVYAVFVAAGVSPRIELGDGTVRGQAVWIGAEALVAAAAFGLAGVATLSTVDFSDPRAGRRRTLLAAGLLLAVVLLALYLGHRAAVLDPTLGLALSGAVTIGAASGLGVVWWRADPDRVPVAFTPRAPSSGGRAWGSRGR